MYQFTINTTLLLAIVSAGLALLFDWFPPVAKWFDGKDEATKKLLNAGLLFAVAAILFAGQCGGLFDTNYACTTKGGLDLLVVWFGSVTLNYGVHAGLKPTRARKAKLLKQPA